MLLGKVGQELAGGEKRLDGLLVGLGKGDFAIEEGTLLIDGCVHGHPHLRADAAPDFKHSSRISPRCIYRSSDAQSTWVNRNSLPLVESGGILRLCSALSGGASNFSWASRWTQTC